MAETCNIDRLLGKLNERTEIMARDIRDVKDIIRDTHEDHAGRLKSLEIRAAESNGGVKMLAGLLTISASVGGLIATFIAKFWHAA